MQNQMNLNISTNDKFRGQNNPYFFPLKEMGRRQKRKYILMTVKKVPGT